MTMLKLSARSAALSLAFGCTLAGAQGGAAAVPSGEASGAAKATPGHTGSGTVSPKATAPARAQPRAPKSSDHAVKNAPDKARGISNTDAGKGGAHAPGTSSEGTRAPGSAGTSGSGSQGVSGAGNGGT